tara:strand:+ start:4675 stop:5799 length:1125 start_codon:yes stop_codon:yes gene_type:complete
MSRNRVIYQSESLYVSKDASSTSSGDHEELIRVQSANYGFNINRQDVNQYGNLARIDSLVLEAPTVNFDFSYYLGDGFNEKALGFDITSNAQFPSGFLETSSGRNFYIVTSDEGQDSVNFLGGDSYSLIGIGNAFLSDYSVDLSVGSLPTATVSFEAANINSTNGIVEGDTFSSLHMSGESPAIDIEQGTPLGEEVSILKPTNTGQGGPTALRPGDIYISFPGFTEDNGSLVKISGDGQFHLQSANLSLPLSRTSIERLGSKFPFARVVDFPVNASLSVNAIVSEQETRDLSALISGCSSSNGEVQITMQSCDGLDAMIWNLKGATLDSESYSSSIGSNKTVDLAFGVQLGGVDDVENGIVCSGSGQNRPIFTL